MLFRWSITNGYTSDTNRNEEVNQRNSKNKKSHRRIQKKMEGNVGGIPENTLKYKPSRRIGLGRRRKH
jgi:hypothetical protein